MSRLFKRSKQAFTLIELLVTVGIMAVVVTLTIPSFSGLGRGAKMDSALSGLKTTMSLARQWAITHRDTVYVVFPADGQTDEEFQYKKCSSYGVYSVNDEQVIKEWSYLPEGIVFEEEQLNRLENLPSSIDIDVPGMSGPALKAIAYNQHGALTSGADTKIIYLVEGAYDPQSGQIIETFNNDVKDAVKVNGLTGLPYIERDIEGGSQ